MKTTLILDGLNCPNCAGKIENKIKNDARFENVEFNFINKNLTLEHNMKIEKLIEEIDIIVSGIEDGITVLEKGAEHCAASCAECGHCKAGGHEHSHEHGHEHSHGHYRDAGEGVIFALRTAMVVILLIVYFVLIKSPFIILAAYIIAGYDVILSAAKNISRGRVFDENFLMSIATIGAFALGEYTEALAVMVFYQIGEFLQDMAVDHSRRSISDLMDMKIEYADLVVDGEITQIPPEKINIGDILLVKSGAKVPVDGIVTEGASAVDTAALTGESVPRSVTVGDKVLSGYIVSGKAVKIKAECRYENSTAARILEMTENAAAHKAKAENFITAFARVYTPAVVVLALLLAIVPCVIQGFDTQWIKRALIFLVASCPCALVLSVPLCFFSGIGKASRQGVLIKGSSYIQTLSKIKNIAFDKTGTLTTGEFTINSANEETLALAAALEQYSSHPIARAIVEAYGAAPEEASDTEEISGFGITGIYKGKKAAVGSRALMEKLNIPTDNPDADVFAALDGKLVGSISICDTLKDDSAITVRSLAALGINSVMFTGDTRSNAEETAKKAGIKDYRYEMLPGDKLEAVEALKKKHGLTAFMGDGINDAPVLAGADVGIAMGGIGSDAAIEAADMVIMGDKPSAILRAVETSRRTMTVLKQNVAFVLAVKFIVLALAAAGLGNMWLAVFADVGTALIAVVNSLRILRD